MSGTDPVAALIHLGQLLLVDKLFLTAAKCLWTYDYLLTLGDEVRYAWSGRKSGVFALFIAVRYTPVVHLIYIHLTMFAFGTTFCRYTQWVPAFNSSATTTFSHMAVALRIYAITRRNKVLAAALAVIIAGEACWNLYSIIRIALGPMQLFPALGLDAFHLCASKHWEAQELAYYSLAMTFEAFAFSIIVVTVVRSRMGGFIAVPTILSVILRDATQYFVVIFSVHILSVFFLFLAPAFIKLLPGLVNAALVPILTSRLMLSLKKAAAEPEGPWSVDTMRSVSWGSSGEGGAIRFAPWQVSGGTDQLSLTPTPPDEDIELGAIPSLPRNSESS